VKVTIIEGPETDKRIQLVYQYILNIYRSKMQEEREEKHNVQDEG
jgi:hypothetical protein